MFPLSLSVACTLNVPIPILQTEKRDSQAQGRVVGCKDISDLAWTNPISASDNVGATVLGRY